MCNPHSSKAKKDILTDFFLFVIFRGVKSSFRTLQVMRRLWCTFKARVDSDEKVRLFIPVELKLIAATFCNMTRKNTLQHTTRSCSVLFSLHQAIVQDKAYSNFLITPTHRNSQFIHIHRRANLPEKSSGNEKNPPTSIFIYLVLIHLELMVISVNYELKWKPVLFAKVANDLLILWEQCWVEKTRGNNGKELVWGEGMR